jgi:hypothetical protein
VNNETLKQKKNFLAEINLPVDKQANKVVDLYVNHSEIKELFKHF